MKKQALLLFGSFILGWLIHYYFTIFSSSQTSSPLSFSTEIESSPNSKSPQIIEKIVEKEVIKYVPQTKIVYVERKKKSDANTTQDLFLLALSKKNFDDAMRYYEDSDEEQHLMYQGALFGYFQALENAKPFLAEEQMYTFIDIDADCKVIVFQLADLFVKHKRYDDALDVIIDFSYISSNSELSTIYMKLKNISLAYMIELKNSHSFEPLIEFLTNRINIGIISDFYSFELAKVYLEVKKYKYSLEILEEIRENDIYKERATELITFIQNKLEEQEEYPIQIPLIRDGLHFVVKAYANNVPLRLLLDTGASVTTVDSNKISDFRVLEENAKFLTAGGNVYNTIYEADTFTVDSISIKRFRLSGTEFVHGRIDGLLGMNFLGRYKFKIDQKEAILFLGNKNSY